MRRAALALAEHQHQQFAALKSFIYTVNGLFILLGALVAVTQSSWLWLGAAFFAGQIVHSWWYERRAGERLDELRTYNTDTFSAVDK